MTSNSSTKVNPSTFLFTNLQTTQEPRALFPNHCLLELVALLGNHLIEVTSDVSTIRKFTYLSAK
jgi:hypothetical protein